MVSSGLFSRLLARRLRYVGTDESSEAALEINMTALSRHVFQCSTAPAGFAPTETKLEDQTSDTHSHGYFTVGVTEGSSFEMSTTQRHCPSESMRQTEIPLRWRVIGVPFGPGTVSSSVPRM